MVFKVKREYSWGDYKYNIDASIVGNVFEQIEEEQGSVTREAFLEKSRPEDSPTHKLFEWDDAKAAEAYRLNTSTKIINALRIKYLDNDNEPQPVVAFIRTTDCGEKPRYSNIISALTAEESKEIILRRLQNELDGLIERNRHIEELADMLITSGNKLKRKKK